MEYQLNSPEEKEEFAKQMIDYMAKNKIKSPNTETYDQLYYQVLNQLKSKKNIKKINIQGMDGFQYKPVKKKAMYKEALFGFGKGDDKERKSVALETLKGAGKGALYGGGIGLGVGGIIGPGTYLALDVLPEYLKNRRTNNKATAIAGILASIFKPKSRPATRNFMLSQLLTVAPPVLGITTGAPIGAVKGMRDAMAYNQTV